MKQCNRHMTLLLRNLGRETQRLHLRPHRPVHATHWKLSIKQDFQQPTTTFVVRFYATASKGLHEEVASSNDVLLYVWSQFIKLELQNVVASCTACHAGLRCKYMMARGRGD